MFRKIITIVIILLLVCGIALGALWLVGRGTAKKNGTTPPSFRQFLGIGTSGNSKNTIATNNGSFTSTDTTGDAPITANSTGSTNGVGGAGTGSSTSTLSGANATGGIDNLQSSQFTSGPLTPGDAGSLTPDNSITSPGSLGSAGNFVSTGSGVGTAGSTSGSATSSGGSTSSGGTSTTPTKSVATAVVTCTAADTNITFTPTEIAQLNSLQKQYNAIAATLATPADASSELSTYSNYKIEEKKIADFQNFCQNTTPLLSDPELKMHVPTPFWHDSTQDTETFSGGGIVPSSTTTFSSNSPSTAESALERILRINLW